MDDTKLELYRNLLLKKKASGLKDLYYFNRNIIEADPSRRRLLVPHVHGEWSEWYQKSNKRIKLILVPRATFKSTFFTVGRTLQALAQNRDHRILIANATLANAQKFLGEIKEHLRKNEQYLELYGSEMPFYDKALKWNEDEIEILGRSLGIKEASVTAVGVGGNLVSQHYSMIIADDLMNELNSATRYQTEKVVDWWKRALSLLDYDGEMILIGTRWSYHDLYSFIEENFPDKAEIYIRGAYKEDGSCYFPEVLNEEKLAELKSFQGSYIFSAFYLNNPVDEDSALIKHSQILYYGEHEEQRLPNNLLTFAMCDPAISQSEHADESSITIASIDADNNWYIREVRSGRWTVGELVENLFSVYNDWKPETISIEVIGQGQMLMEYIYDEENRRNTYISIHEITSRPPIKKELRIRSVLQPRFERGKVFIPRGQFDLEDQLLKFPHSQRDDIIDSLTDLAEIGFAPDPVVNPETSTADSFFQVALEKQKNKKEPVGDSVMGEYF